MNPATMMKLISAKNKFTGNHPRFSAFISAVLKGGLEEGTIIEISVIKPGRDKITTNLRVQESDLELFEQLKALAANQK